MTYETEVELPGTHNPDAAAWAKSFCQHFPDADEGLMLGWFANAMMAMHDHLMQAREWNTRAATATDTALVEDLMSAPYEWHGPFGKEKHRIIPPTLFDRILAVLEGKRT